MHGPVLGYGAHILFALGALVLSLALLSGFFVALYFVVRIAVTRGILRADAVRANPRPVAVAPAATPATPTATYDSAIDRPAPPVPDRTDDPSI